MRSKINRFLLISIFTILQLSFVNCTKFEVADLTSATGKVFRSEGNGSSYGGKPTGLKYRLVPNFRCEDKEAPKAILDIAAQTFSHFDSQTNACQIQAQNFSLDKLEHSIYQDDIVGFNEGIFEPLETEFVKVPDNLAEVWCMDYSDSLKVEVINYFNRVTQKSYTKIYYTEESSKGVSVPQSYPEISSSRVLTYNSVVLYSGTELDLRVMRDQPDSIGRFKSQLKLDVAGKSITKELYCRLGGSIDVTLWPINPVATLPVFDYMVSPSKGSVMYSSLNKDTKTMSLGMVNFASGEDLVVDPGIQKNMQNPFIASIRGKVKFAYDGQALVYQTASQLVEYNIASKAKSMRVDGAADVVSFVNTPDGQSIVYKTRGKNLPRVDSLFSKNIKTGIIYPIKPTSCKDGDIGNYSMSPVNNRIILSCGSSQNLSIFTARLDGTDFQQVYLPAGLKEYVFTGLYFVKPAKVPFIGGPLDYGLSDLVYVHANLPAQINYNTKVLLYKISTNTFLEVPNGNGQFVNDNYYIFPNVSTQNPHGIVIIDSVNFKSREVNDYIAIRDGRFYPGIQLDSSGQFFALKKNPAGAFELKAVDLSAVVSERTLCPALRLEEISLSPVMNNVLYMAHRSGNIIYFTKIDTLTSECKTLNSIPIPLGSSKLTLGEIVFNSKKNYLAFEYLATDEKGQGKEDLYLIPLNGSPAYMVSFPATASARIDDFIFAENGESLYFWGNQADGNKRNIYKVKAK